MLILRRFLAYIIDILIIYAMLFPVVFGLQKLFNINPGSGFEVWVIILLTFSIPSWTYFIKLESSVKQQTLGKQLMRIGVFSLANNRISLRQAVIRTIIKLLPWELFHITIFALSDDLSVWTETKTIYIVIVYILIFLYLGVIIYYKGERGLHDIFARTIVRIKNS